MIETEDIAPAWLVQTVVDWAVQSFHSDSYGDQLDLSPGAAMSIHQILVDLGADDEIDNALEEFRGEPEIEALIDVYGFDQICAALGRGHIYEYRPPQASTRIVMRASQVRIIFYGATRLDVRELELAADTLQGAMPIGLSVSDRMVAAVINYLHHLIEDKS